MFGKSAAVPLWRWLHSQGAGLPARMRRGAETLTQNIHNSVASPLVCGSTAHIGGQRRHKITHARADRPATRIAAQSRYLSQALPDTTADSVLIERFGLLREVDASFLRLNCICSSCQEPSSGQRRFGSVQLAQSYNVSQVYFDERQDSYDVTFSDGHVANVPGSSIDYLLGLESCGEGNSPVPIPSSPGAIPSQSFNTTCNGAEGLFSWLYALGCTGSCLITDSPLENNVVVDLANLISRPQETMYGTTFEVETQDNPINIAYSPLALDLHQDLIYLESPPGLQLLHCLRFDESVTGGESVLMDGFCLGERMRQVAPDHFDTLCQIRTTFQKVHYARADPVHIVSRRPTFVVDEDDGAISQVNWAPAFEGPLRCPDISQQRRYYDAYRCLANIVGESSDLLMTFRLKPGDVITFNNRRMLHGRRAFAEQSGGKRHLRGVYVNIDDFSSRLSYLCKVNNVVPPPHVGHGN